MERYFQLVLNRATSSKRHIVLCMWCLGAQRFATYHPDKKAVHEVYEGAAKNVFETLHSALNYRVAQEKGSNQKRSSQPFVLAIREALNVSVSSDGCQMALLW